MYWPKEGSEKYGLIEVTLAREDTMATYTIRTFRIRHTRIRNGKQGHSERYVLQYHFTAWPDHGAPENPLPLLSFVRRSSDANRDCSAPIVVHCSAGVGRTGAYILVDAMLKQMKAKGELNLVAFLKYIRTQRNHLVQTEEQYTFVHDALAEAVASGETNINRTYLSRYINSLQSSFTTDENSIPWQLLDRQFKLATAYQPQEIQFMAALKPCNQHKNRNFDYLPIESARVALSAKPGVDGSDYINASWMPGFNKHREFIITQHPLEQTVADFWRMLWDQNVRTVVILSPVTQPEFGIFWPGPQMSIEMETMRVSLVDESEANGYQIKDFSLVSINEEFELTVRLIFSPSWPHLCTPLSTTTEFANLVQNIHIQRGGGGPLAVMDRFGGTEAAFYCAISSLLKQLDYENHVDVYEYTKVSHTRRPGVWRSQEDYFHLYRIMDSICSLDGTSQFELSPVSPVTGLYQQQAAYFMTGSTAPLCPGSSSSVGLNASNGQLQSAHTTFMQIPQSGSSFQIQQPVPVQQQQRY
jgi:receptor-type tyrosine-protein phosphatase gamma